LSPDYSFVCTWGIFDFERIIGDPRSSLSTRSSGTLLAGSTERLTLTGCRGRLDRVQHAMARDARRRA